MNARVFAKRLVPVVAIALVATACGNLGLTPSPGSPGGGNTGECRSMAAGLTRIRGALAVRGQALVRFRQDADRRRALAALRLSELRAIGGLALVQLPESEDAERAIGRLRASPLVLDAEPNYVARVRAVPNDPRFSDQWGLAQAGLPAAWDVTTGSSGVVVAVLDTGIRRDHPDLGSNVLQGRDVCQGDGDPTDPGDPSNPGELSHGTLVTGIIGALTNNGVGIAGVSWGPNGVRILPVRVCNGRGDCTYADLIEGMRWAVDNGARVINVSLAGTSPSDALRQAVEDAANRGAVVVAAAGNEGGTSIDFPARYPGAIAVGASTSGGGRAGYSNCGPELSVIAPGGDSTRGVLSTAWSPSGGSGYAEVAGTSFATPHVAGVAALILSRRSRTPAQVQSVIENTADDVGASGRDNCTGFGRLDAAGAVNAP